ncbi:hypothetical protein BC834DRAFT_98920 [Gloeopeniophorella convolvens]|nr:hypothetical protein BC834DRAFT_98920 [Gloeopeniophorella convolvens]
MNVSVVSERTPGQVILYLNPKQPVPILPYELHEHVTADAWATRIPQLVRMSARYNKPIMEGVLFLFALIASIAVPTGVHNLILHSLEKKDNDNFDALHQSRLISIAIAFGVAFAIYTPLIVWKSLGQARASKLVKRWEAEDARIGASGAFVPVWTVKLSSSFSYNTRLTITTPHAPMHSYFHPAAYMPSWINGPIDPSANNGFPGVQQGFQKPNMYGDVPLYGNYNGPPNGATPPYVADGAPHYSDEKQGFSDSKV